MLTYGSFSALFEYTLAYHCAPALAGIKPSDLISWPEERCGELVDGYAKNLARAGISLRTLGRRGGRRLILVYRENRLAEQLERPEVRALLRRDGYPVGEGLEPMLAFLRERLACPCQFPHEVGLFLGYPAEDVEGFRKNGGRGCKFSGMWKVYSDVERARESFFRYDRCRQDLCTRLEKGFHLCGLFGAGAA